MSVERVYACRTALGKLRDRQAGLSMETREDIAKELERLERLANAYRDASGVVGKTDLLAKVQREAYALEAMPGDDDQRAAAVLREAETFITGKPAPTRLVSPSGFEFAPSPLGGLAEVVAEYDHITAKADPRNPEWDFVMRSSDYWTLRAAISPSGVQFADFRRGMEEAAKLLDEEAASADKLIVEHANSGNSHGKMRLWAIRDHIQTMAKTLRGFAADAAWVASALKGRS